MSAQEKEGSTVDKIWLRHYPPSVPTEINPDAYSSLVDLFERCSAEYAARPALRNMGCRLNYREWHEKSRNFAAFLQGRLHLRKADRLAIMLPNCLQYPVAIFGALMAGLTVVNCNPLYTARELVMQLNDAGAEAIVVLANFAHVLERALPETQVKAVIVTELGDLCGFFKAPIVNYVVRRIKKLVPAWQIPGAMAFRQVLAQGKRMAFSAVEVCGDDIAFLQYTGGTTGVSKGAVLTHRNMVANVEQCVAWVDGKLERGLEVSVTALPLYHIFSLTVCCLTFLRLGACSVVITNPRDISGLVKELARVPFSVLLGVNTLFAALMNNARFRSLDFKRLKITIAGGMAVQKVIAEKWHKITGNLITEGYGLTEASPVVTINPVNQKRFNGSIGLPISSTEVSIRDDDGKERGIREEGELCVRGPQVMRGYWRNEEETRGVFTPDGWLKTGDIAYLSEDGHVYLVDRKKDMILVSGFNVYPNEVEEVIAAHPGVLEVAVIGASSRHSGQVVKAIIVKKDPALTKDKIVAYCKERLTGYKVPKRIEFRDELPKSNVGKILRRVLREEGRR